MSSNGKDQRAITLLKKALLTNDIQVLSTKNEQGITELHFVTTEEVLSLEYLREEFGDFSADYRVLSTHSGAQMAIELSKLTGLRTLNAVRPCYGNEEPRINIEGHIEGENLVLIAPRCRSICDNPSIGKRFLSPADVYGEMRGILQAITLNGNRETTTRLVLPYISCGKKDKMEGHGDLPLAEMGEDLERYEHICGTLSFFLHSENTVNCFRRFRVDNTKMAPPFVRVIERIILMDKLDLAKVCIGAIDDSGVKKGNPIAEAMGLPLFIDFKTRPDHNSAKSTGTIGDVKNKTVFVVDDLVQSFGTGMKGIKKCQEGEPEGIYMVVGAPDFTYSETFQKDAVDLILEHPFIKRFIIFDTTPLISLLIDRAIETNKTDKIVIVKFVSLLAHYIWRKILSLSSEDLRTAKPKHSLVAANI